MMVVAIFVTAVMQIPSILLIRRVAPGLRLHWRAADRRQLRTVAGFSSSTFITNLAGQLKTKTDEIVIGLFLPLAAVTPYALANRLSETAQIFAQQFIKVLLPIASMYDATDARERLRIAVCLEHAADAGHLCAVCLCAGGAGAAAADAVGRRGVCQFDSAGADPDAGAAV